MHIKNLSKGSLLFVAIAITIAITYLSLTKISVKGISISNIDKLQHLIAYFALTLSWLLALKRTEANNRVKYFIVFACIFYGIIIEVFQVMLTSYREASLLDALANSIGALLAMLVFNIKFEKKQAI